MVIAEGIIQADFVLLKSIRVKRSFAIQYRHYSVFSNDIFFYRKSVKR